MAEDVIKARIIFDTSGLERMAGGVSGGNGGAGKMSAAGGQIPSMKGAFGSLAKSLAPLGVMAAGVTATVMILGKINDAVNKSLKKLEEIAPDFKASRDIQRKMLDMTLRPMAAVMTILMKPYLLLQMLVLRKALKESAVVLRDLKSGQITPEAAIEQLKPIFKGSVEAMGWLNKEMTSELKDLAGYLEGYNEGIQIVFNTWLDGIVEWTKGFLDAMGSSFLFMPDYLVETITENVTDLADIPSKVAYKYLLALLAKTDDFDSLPEIAKKHFTPEVIALANEIADGMVEAKDAVNTISDGVDAVGGAFTWAAQKIREYAEEAFKVGSKGGAVGGGGFGKTSKTLLGIGLGGALGGLPGAIGGGLIGSGKGKGFLKKIGSFLNPFDDFISRPGQAPVPFSPDDTIIGVKDTSKLGGASGGSSRNITININAMDASSISPSIIDKISNAIERNLTGSLAGVSSQAWGY